MVVTFPETLIVPVPLAVWLAVGPTENWVYGPVPAEFTQKMPKKFPVEAVAVRKWAVSPVPHGAPARLGRGAEPVTSGSTGEKATTVPVLLMEPAITSAGVVV